MRWLCGSTWIARSIPRSSDGRFSFQRADVPLHPGELRAFDRAFCKQPREIRLPEPKKVADRRRAVVVASRERRMRFGRTFVPGTDFLADVAAERVAREACVVGQITAML